MATDLYLSAQTGGQLLAMGKYLNQKVCEIHN